MIYQFPLHGDIRRNIASAAHGEIGDVEKGFKEADLVIERTYQTNQIQCTPLEPHVCYAKIDGGRLVLHASTQVPYHVRRIVARVCEIPEHKVRVIKERVGGGYGSKQDILVEDLVGYATWLTGKPVYYRNTREEEFIANSTRHPMRITMKLGAKKDGTLTGVYMDVRANTGPYGNHCLTVPMNACSKTLPLLKCDNMKFDVYTYYTNIPPTGAYQGYGAPKGTYAMMTALAELADGLGIDYYDLVDKNKIESGYMLEILRGLGEGREGKVVPVGSCGLGEALAKGARMIDWGKKEKGPGGDWKIGKGFAIIQQGSGLRVSTTAMHGRNCFPTGTSSSFPAERISEPVWIRFTPRSRPKASSSPLTKSTLPAVIRTAVPSIPEHMHLRGRTSAAMPPTMRSKI